LSDTHGNPIALDAVLSDIEACGGVDGYWVLGDMAAIGYDPVGVVARLTALPNVRFVQGNTDRYLVTGERPHPHIADAAADHSLLPTLVEVAHTFAWTQGYITGAGWLDWFAALPLEQRMTLPDGTRLLGVHVAPDRNDGEGVHPRLNDQELRKMLNGCAADLVCVGHTHWPTERLLDGIRVVNVGSVSNPLAPDLRASYVLLSATGSGYEIENRRVAYRYDDVIEAVRRCRHPAGEYVIRLFRGEQRPWWEQRALT
jgi:predicted phosphodiesterase